MLGTIPGIPEFPIAKTLICPAGNGKRKRLKKIIARLSLKTRLIERRRVKNPIKHDDKIVAIRIRRPSDIIRKNFSDNDPFPAQIESKKQRGECSIHILKGYLNI